MYAWDSCSVQELASRLDPFFTRIFDTNWRRAASSLPGRLTFRLYSILIKPMGKRWLPLESNPDVLNSFAKGLGFDTSSYAFCDVFGLDEVLQPCHIRSTLLQLLW